MARSVSALALWAFLGPLSPHAAAQDRLVRAVLFFSPTCPHCHEVMTRDLPLFFQVHGGEPQAWMDESVPEADRALYFLYNTELEILLVDATRPLGGRLYEASMVSHPVTETRTGVPRMVMGDAVLVGSAEIPSEFHRLFEEAPSVGALEWPPIEGLEAVTARLPSAEPADTTEATETTETTDTADTTEATDTTVAASTVFETIAERPTSVAERFGRDPVGNGLAVVVLVVMLGSIVAVARGVGSGVISRPGTGIPLLAALGIGVAAYLTYVEGTGTLAVCGPVGDCNAVQQSSYARLFGVIPVGAVGLAGYLAMIGAWAVARREGTKAADWARVALFALTALGTLFSAYLTFLEPFVIGATCAWCLKSAVIVTLLLWLSAAPGRAAWGRLRAKS